VTYLKLFLVAPRNKNLAVDTSLLLPSNEKSKVFGMALVVNWLPPSRENWDLVVSLFTFFPVV
jgi:hypothetical protein